MHALSHPNRLLTPKPITQKNKQVRDLYDRLWYPGIVSRVAPARHAVTIHFLGFNSLWFDEVMVSFRAYFVLFWP